ncbi:hypothetical protein P12x_002642 [Tundrisphaera lichenicola]|uniref:hypothetical protein n=1 Tax=Tundrisphaera lichenicola TaxID=2029860 RepID=UPI003EBDCEE4
MRVDDQNHPELEGNPSLDRPATARIGARAFSSTVLALLMAGTSWVVASWVSAWLVPPYLILMALILLPSSGRPRGGPAEVGPDSADTLGPGLPVEDSAGRATPETSPASAEASVGTDRAADSPPTRGRRGKGRARKAKQAVEPIEATWIEVAPGKFVRSEGPRSSAEAGPHDPMGVPVEAPSTPQPPQADEANPLDRAEAPGSDEASPDVESARPAEALAEEPSFVGAEPAEDALPDSDPVGNPEGNPAGEVLASGSTATSEFAEGSESSGIEGCPSAADGIAPQVEGASFETEAAHPEADFEAEVDRNWSESEVEGSEPGDAPAFEDLAPSPPIESIDLAAEAVDPSESAPSESSGFEEGPMVRARLPEPEVPIEAIDPTGSDEGEAAEVPEAIESSELPDPEPTDWTSLADVATEIVDESMESFEGEDPTEIAVDETVLDDAGTFDGPGDEPDETPAEALLDPEALPGVPGGSAWWPRRIAPRARTRDGHDRRATSNLPPHRRLVRSRGPAHRPPDPRRITRRGAGRPRQITRTFPPRSPPGTRLSGRSMLMI